ncbi:hypothetical protein BEH94_11085 [Candidatus Altiarchaeales archaeon WOR_SM1_SCG]|nr:hypothetical protein BEH94_11085 [Candidatus Altiarchaeales archaeon WOR_SM1_SCG]
MKLNSNSNTIIETCKTVYEPSDDSYLLLENLPAKKGDFYLDVGTGTGILAIELAKRGCRVVAIDINKKAVELAKRNAKLNRIDNLIEFRKSDLFENVPEIFDFIVFNTPYLPVSDKGTLAGAWSGGKNFNTIHRFLSGVGEHLKVNGKFEILISSLTKLNLEKYKNKFEFQKIACKKLFFEEIYVLLGRLKN